MNETPRNPERIESEKRLLENRISPPVALDSFPEADRPLVASVRALDATVRLARAVRSVPDDPHVTTGEADVARAMGELHAWLAWRSGERAARGAEWAAKQNYPPPPRPDPWQGEP